jgi:hypothetical protein
MAGIGSFVEAKALQQFGVDLSKGDLADLYATCVSCMNHAVDTATSTTEKMNHSVLRLRLTRWGKAVNIDDKPVLGSYDPQPDELSEIKKFLVSIITFFDSENGPLDEGFIYENVENQEAERLQKALHMIASERRPGGKSLIDFQNSKLAQWTWKHSQPVADAIGHLEHHFGSEELRELCAEERLRINDEGLLKLLGDIVYQLDPWMSTAIDPGVYTFSHHAGHVVYNNSVGYQYNVLPGAARFDVHFDGSIGKAKLSEL